MQLKGKCGRYVPIDGTHGKLKLPKEFLFLSSCRMNCPYLLGNDGNIGFDGYIGT